MRKLYVVGDDGVQKEYAIPRGVHINVQEGERVHSGDPLMDGPRNPHDILAVLGEKELQKYLVNEIQEVYRLQGVNINDKHLEVISRQMMRWVRIEDIGDTEFLPEEVVDKFKFREENNRVIEAGGRPAMGKPILLGITKASLSTDSFISAASFQETTRVLTEAAINGKVDYLRGLKENVIMGRLIPAGTGMEFYRKVKIAGEDVVEEEPIPEEEVSLSDGLGDYSDDTPGIYTGGLSEDLAAEEALGRDYDRRVVGSDFSNESAGRLDDRVALFVCDQGVPRGSLKLSRGRFEAVCRKTACQIAIPSSSPARAAIIASVHLGPGLARREWKLFDDLSVAFVISLAMQL